MAARVTRTRLPARALRWRWSYNRMLLSAAIVVCAGFCAWRMTDPPVRVIERVPAEVQLDRGGELLAGQFARAFLSFDAEDPDLRDRAMAQFGTASSPALAGYEAPRRGRQAISQTQVAQAFKVPQGTRYIVAASTAAGQTTYLAVTVARGQDGALGVVGPPAVVGPPVSAPARAITPGRDVEDPAVQQVAERALRNYLSAAGDDLAADLASTATVSLPAQPMTLERVDELRWESGAPGAVLVTASVRDTHGQLMQLAYELALQPQQDRWLVAGIQNNPTGL